MYVLLMGKGKRIIKKNVNILYNLIAKSYFRKKKSQSKSCQGTCLFPQKYLHCVE